VHRTSDINVIETRPLPSPAELMAALPKTEAQADCIVRSRDAIHRILFGDDPRLLVVVGPCSIHDLDGGREYGRRLAALAKELEDRLVVAMRVYFEKPRTTVGWKGLILDPHLDGSSDIQHGLYLARQFLREILDLGLPTATEFLDPITPQYIADLVSWAAIGARTTESQTHRQLASGLSMPLGFKNGTDGSIQTAINAIKAASQPQTFLGITTDGRAASVRTSGNPNCHIVLRGGATGPNYGAAPVAAAAQLLAKAGLHPSILVDCSHDNSAKQPERQPEILREVLAQITADPQSPVMGVMIESNLFAGSQPFPRPRAELQYGVSITDGCIDWPTTEAVLREAYRALGPSRAAARAAT
jgi:3-deoxy-7-phosphoheptulonate synthase